MDVRVCVQNEHKYVAQNTRLPNIFPPTKQTKQKRRESHNRSLCEYYCKKVDPI